MTTIPPNNNFNSRTGRIATDLSDFKSHLDGDISKPGFKHNSDKIDINPTLTIDGTPVNNVTDALTTIRDFITSQASIGEGFITVGEGYDTYTNPALDPIFDKTVPSLDTLLTPSFFSTNSRLKNGGILVIKSGTYIVKQTIEIPPGIVIMGEGYGTKIINATDLDLSVSPPVVKNILPLPVFRIMTDSVNRTLNDGAIAGSSNEFMFGRKTYISNLVISDNFVEITQTGDTYYTLPQNKTGNNPLIQQDEGSNLVLDSVYLMGRANGSLPVVSSATRFAIQLANPSATGTHLKINNCFIDGFSVPIDFRTSAGSSDYLEITNNKIRAFGYLDGYSNLATDHPESNCFIKMNDCNAIITNNQLFGSNPYTSCAVFIDTCLISPPFLQAKSKVIISGNNITIDKTSNSNNSYYINLRINTSIVSITTRLYSIVFGNVFQETSGFEIYINSLLLTKFLDGTITNTAGNYITNIATAGGITNTASNATNGIITNAAGKDIINTATAGNITNTANNATNGIITNTAGNYITNTATTGSITNNAASAINGIITNNAGNFIINTATAGGISNTATNGIIINSAGNFINNTATAGSITNTAANATNGIIANNAGKDITNTATAGGITNTATNGTNGVITNTAGKDITNTAVDYKITASNGTHLLNGGYYTHSKTISNSDSPYTILPADYIILVDTTLNTVTINLPSSANSIDRNLIIKDAAGYVGVNNITIIPNGSDTIERVSGNKIISIVNTVLKLYCNSTNWYIL